MQRARRRRHRRYRRSVAAAAEADDLHRHAAIRRRVVAELTVRVEAPRPQRSVALQRDVVIITRGDCHDVRQVDDLHGCVTLDAGAIAQFGSADVVGHVVVATPRPDRAVGFQRGAVTIAARNGDHTGEADDLHGVIRIGRRVVADLTVPVLAPGPHGAVGLYGYRVLPAGGYLLHARESRHHDGRCARRAGERVSKLAVPVRAPRAKRVIRHQRDAEVVAARHGNHACQARNVNGNVAIRRRAVAELSGPIHAPRPDGAVRGDRQTVIPAATERDDVRQANDLHRGVAIGVGAVAKLTEAVEAPRPHRAVRLQREVVAFAAHDCADASEESDGPRAVDLDRRVSIVVGTVRERGGAVAELAGPVVAPVPDGAIREEDDAVPRAAPQRHDGRRGTRRALRHGLRDADGRVCGDADSDRRHQQPASESLHGNAAFSATAVPAPFTEVVCVQSIS